MGTLESEEGRERGREGRKEKKRERKGRRGKEGVKERKKEREDRQSHGITGTGAALGRDSPGKAKLQGAAAPNDSEGDLGADPLFWWVSPGRAAV